MRKRLTLVVLLLFAAPAFADRFVVLFRKGAAWDEAKAPHEQQHFGAHSANLRALRTATQLYLGARYADVGMIVVEASNEAAARALIDRDPSVVAKVFTYDLHPASFFYEPLGAPTTRTFDVTTPVPRLTDAQRRWLETFEQEAATLDTDFVARSATSARAAGLTATANHLDTGARVLRGEATVESLERAFRMTLDEPLHVLLRILDGKLADVVVAVPNREKSSDVSRASVHAFERTLPGFAEEWIAPVAPEEIGRVATLRFRTGSAIASTSPASYLPFDRALNTSVGRTWLVYDNMLAAGWFATKVKPAADAVLPSLAPQVRADAMVRWYALRTPIYDAGPNLTATQLDTFGDDKDPLRILKADVLCTLAAGAKDEDLATLLAVTFHTLHETYAGSAPPAHRRASNTLVNWLATHGTLNFDRTKGVWTADLSAMGKALNDLTRELLEIETNLDTTRAKALFAKHGNATPDIDRTAIAIAALPKQTITPRYKNN